MKASTADSVIDVAYWYFDKATENKQFLEDEKLQLLLFLSQIYYARTYNGEILLPSVFFCDENGFYDPNIKKLLSLGRPYMPRAKFDTKVSTFLEEIWEKFGTRNHSELTKLVKNSILYQEEHKKNTKTLVEAKTIVESLNKHSKIFASEEEKNTAKVLLSQNGPVVVSPWKPRKLTTGSRNNKEDNNV